MPYNYDRSFVAMKHPSEEALKKYLHEHPKADPKNHSVSEGSKGSDGPSAEEAEKTKKVVNDAMRGAGAPKMIHGMGLSEKDARAVLKNWFQNKPPSNPKHQKAWQYLHGAGQEHLSKVLDTVRQALKKSGQGTSLKDVAKAVDNWMKD